MPLHTVAQNLQKLPQSRNTASQILASVTPNSVTAYMNVSSRPSRHLKMPLTLQEVSRDPGVPNPAGVDKI
jgi:hypothetical protein